MTIVLDYDNDQIRLEDQKPYTFLMVNKKALDRTASLLSEVFNRIGYDNPLDVTIRRQSDGELQTLEEW